MRPATSPSRTAMRPDGSRLIKFSFGEELPFVSHGRGVFVHDTDGRRYLDGCSGAVTANLGHADPEILRVMSEQARRITFAQSIGFERIHEQTYQEFGFELVEVPPGALTARAELIESATRVRP